SGAARTAGPPRAAKRALRPAGSRHRLQLEPPDHPEHGGRRRGRHAARLECGTERLECQRRLVPQGPRRVPRLQLLAGGRRRRPGHRQAHGVDHRRADHGVLTRPGDLLPAGRGSADDAEPRARRGAGQRRPLGHADLGHLPQPGEPMIRPAPHRGFVLLVVLAAAAVLSLIAAFVYSRTEDQLLLSVTSRGQSIAAARATLAAERKLAIYRAAYPSSTLGGLVPVDSYDSAIDAGTPQVGDREFANYDHTTYPALDVSSGGGAQWCTQTWLLFRGTGIPPWTV